jgi:hypothetical protein
VSCSQGPSVSRWQTGSEPGTALACNELFSRLSLRVYNARVFKGVLEIPGNDDRCISVSHAHVAAEPPCVRDFTRCDGRQFRG